MQSDSKKVLDGDHLDLPPAKDKNNSGKKCIGKKFPLTIKIKGSQLNTCFLSDLAINSVFFSKKQQLLFPFIAHICHFLQLFSSQIFPYVLTALSSKTIKQLKSWIYWKSVWIFAPKIIEKKVKAFWPILAWKFKFMKNHLHKYYFWREKFKF